MKTVKKNVYYCDCCNKRGLSAAHILKHEKGCTINPDRECGLCQRKDIKPIIEKLKASFTLTENPYGKDAGGYPMPPSESHTVVWIGEPVTLKDIEREADWCPNCILALLRLTGMNKHYFGFDYNYKNALSNHWAVRDPRSYDY